MEKAIIYCRVSTMEQAQKGVSIDAQVERLSSYAGAMGLEIVDVIREEGVSASKPLALRPGGIRLINALKSGKADNVVALKLDRLFRSTEDALRQTTEWDSEGVGVHFVDMGGNQINTKSAMGKILLTLLAAFAEFERTLIAERTAAALAHKKQRRKVYNHAPYGFVCEGDQLVPVDSEQRVLRQIFEMRKQGLSLFKIAERLNDFGVPAKRGGKWHQGTLGNIVNNELYRDPADNLIPLRKKEGPSADEKFVGQLAGAIKELDGAHPDYQ